MADAARIRVILPDAKARILFNETATKQEGTDRLFYTPPLKGRTTNEYLIRATFTQGGREVTLDRLVSVDPGMTYVVDFTRR